MVNKFKQVLENNGPKFKIGDIGHPSNDFTPAGTGRIEIIGLSGYGTNMTYRVKFIDRGVVEELGVTIVDFMFNTATEMILYNE